jgi:hypothetical protein
VYKKLKKLDLNPPKIGPFILILPASPGNTMDIISATSS